MAAAKMTMVLEGAPRAAQKLLKIDGGMSGASNFPETSRVLEGDERLLSAMQALAERDEDQYWSLIDFLICSFFPQFKAACLNYYADRGPPLRTIMEPRALADRDLAIALALQIVQARVRRVERDAQKVLDLHMA